MTKDELVDRIAMKLGTVVRHQVDASVNLILELMTETLINDDRVEIRGFGSFQNHHIKAKIGRNPKTGEKVNVGAKKVPHFKVGKELRERVNATFGS